MDRAAQSDNSLLAAWVAGSPDAGNELIERHFLLVHRFFHNKVGVGLDDLVQQTFLGCFEAAHRYEERASFKTFLLAIARNQLYRHYRQQRNQRLDFSSRSARDLGASPTGATAQREMERLLLQALQRIPLEAQVILELLYWEDMSTAEIGTVLEVPVNTVYSRLHRARQSLRRVLAELAPDVEVPLGGAEQDPACQNNHRAHRSDRRT